MAGILKVDDLRGNTSAGDITITSEGGGATQSLQQGMIKAWSHFDGNDATLSLDDSLNMASLTDGGTGRYTTNFTNNMNNNSFACTAGSQRGANWPDKRDVNSMTTALVSCHQTNTSAYVDAAMFLTMVAGDLA
jgi:hypothetical protein